MKNETGRREKDTSDKETVTSVRKTRTEIKRDKINFYHFFNRIKIISNMQVSILHSLTRTVFK